MPGGQDGQVGFVTEVTPGTAVTVTKFIPIVSENIKNNITYLDTKTISARKVLRLTKPGTKEISGSISTELPNVPMATLLKHMFGTINTTGAGPYEHTATPGDLTGDSLTIQVGRPATSGTVHPFTYAGCKISEWTIACQLGEIATLDLDVIGMSEVTATALATASYSASWEPFTFIEGSVSVAGSPVASIKSFTLTGNNMIEPRFRIGSGNSVQPLETSLREYTGQIVGDFDSLTHYGLYTAGTETAIVLSFDNGTDTLTITMNVMFTGETPELSGFELLEQNLPFRALSSTSDAAAITAVLTNSEATA